MALYLPWNRWPTLRNDHRAPDFFDFTLCGLGRGVWLLNNSDQTVAGFSQAARAHARGLAALKRGDSRL